MWAGAIGQAGNGSGICGHALDNDEWILFDFIHRKAEGQIWKFSRTNLRPCVAKDQIFQVVNYNDSSGNCNFTTVNLQLKHSRS